MPDLHKFIIGLPLWIVGQIKEQVGTAWDLVKDLNISKPDFDASYETLFNCTKALFKKSVGLFTDDDTQFGRVLRGLVLPKERTVERELYKKGMELIWGKAIILQTYKCHPAFDGYFISRDSYNAFKAALSYHPDYAEKMNQKLSSWIVKRTPEITVQGKTYTVT